MIFTELSGSDSVQVYVVSLTGYHVFPRCDNFYRLEKRCFAFSRFFFATTRTCYTLVSRRLVRQSKRERSTYHRLIRSSSCSSYYPCMNARFDTDPYCVSHGIVRAETFKTYPANPSADGEARCGLTTLSTTISFFHENYCTLPHTEGRLFYNTLTRNMENS